MFRALAAAAIVLGAVAFLAIPAYSKHSPPRQGLAMCPPNASPLICSTPGGYYTTQDYSTYANIDCDLFEMGDSCASRFWLRAGAFGLAVVIAIVLFALSGGTAPPVKGAAARGFTAADETHSSTSTDTYLERRDAHEAKRLEALDRSGASGAAPAAPASTGASPPSSGSDGMKTCPDCAEEVRIAARKCRFCGYMFEDARTG